MVATLIVLILLAPALMVLLYPARDPARQLRAADVAPEIEGFVKWVASEGEAAISIARRKHIGDIGEELIEDVAIVHYIGHQRAVALWITLYPDACTAKSETDRKVDGILRIGGRWAQTLQMLSLDDLIVYRVSPDNASHYFWASDRYAFWIQPLIGDLTEAEAFEFIRQLS